MDLVISNQNQLLFDARIFSFNVVGQMGYKTGRTKMFYPETTHPTVVVRLSAMDVALD